MNESSDVILLHQLYTLWLTTLASADYVLFIVALAVLLFEVFIRILSAVFDLNEDLRPVKIVGCTFRVPLLRKYNDNANPLNISLAFLAMLIEPNVKERVVEGGAGEGVVGRCRVRHAQRHAQTPTPPAPPLSSSSFGGFGP